MAHETSHFKSEGTQPFLDDILGKRASKKVWHHLPGEEGVLFFRKKKRTQS